MTSREEFEAAWRNEYPLHSTSAFTRSGFEPDRYANTRVQDGWLMWQAARKDKEPCAHVETVIGYDHIFCKKCFAVRTDSQWGRYASNRWFPSYAEAKANRE